MINGRLREISDFFSCGGFFNFFLRFRAPFCLFQLVFQFSKKLQWRTNFFISATRPQRRPYSSQTCREQFARLFYFFCRRPKLVRRPLCASGAQKNRALQNYWTVRSSRNVFGGGSAAITRSQRRRKIRSFKLFRKEQFGKKWGRAPSARVTKLKFRARDFLSAR